MIDKTTEFKIKVFIEACAYFYNISEDRKRINREYKKAKQRCQELAIQFKPEEVWDVKK